MNILVFDSVPTRRDFNVRAIASACPDAVIWYNRDGRIVANKPGVAGLPAEYDLAILHFTDRSSWQSTKSKEYVYYSGSPLYEDNWVTRGVSPDSPLHSWEVVQIVSAWRERRKVSFTASLRPIWNRDPMLAFRLLCEAKKECGTESATKISGIIVHAPVNLEQWLAPFGKTPTDNNAIEHVADMIGSGETKANATAVLDAVNGKGQPLADAIKTFLDPQPAAAQQQQ